MQRKKIASEVDDGGGAYFSAPTKIECISSGCATLDCVLGGGWPLGRIANIVGDKSTGKTLLAIEACANFAKQYPTGKIWYCEAEAAFDKDYARALGLPLDRVEFVECFTVEDLFEDLTKRTDEHPDDTPGLYIQDSLDALSDRAELKRGIDEGTYGAEKAKKMSQLFRRLNKRCSQKRFCVMIISQVRENIGVTFGRSVTRSGGKALDFYASQVLWLAHLGYITRQRSGIERKIGINVRARCDKNKVGLPYRDCEFPIIFGYGIDDVAACTDWLQDVKRLEEVTDLDYKTFKKGLGLIEAHEFDQVRTLLAEAVVKAWYEIEDSFLPKRLKYGEGQ